MKKIVLFGAGKIGVRVATYYIQRGQEVSYFIDNDSNKWGKLIMGIPIISLDDYVQLSGGYMLVLSCNYKNMQEIVNQLEERGIEEYYDCTDYKNRERLVSFSHPHDKEDIILYHVLYNFEHIFYIDVGSNDPLINSVTKLFYDAKDAYGINIEPQRELYEITKRERRRDINLCIGVGKEPATATLYIQGGLSTIIKENAQLKVCETAEIEILTLAQVCNQYIETGQEIAFLKVDVEGAEEAVLLGADFQTYRPWIVVMESTLPGTMEPCYESWEHILLDNQYHYVYSYGVNRYYVADEKSELDERFLGVNELYLIYNILTANVQTCGEDL